MGLEVIPFCGYIWILCFHSTRQWPNISIWNWFTVFSNENIFGSIYFAMLLWKHWTYYVLVYKRSLNDNIVWKLLILHLISHLMKRAHTHTAECFNLVDDEHSVEKIHREPHHQAVVGMKWEKRVRSNECFFKVLQPIINTATLPVGIKFVFFFLFFFWKLDAPNWVLNIFRTYLILFHVILCVHGIVKYIYIALLFALVFVWFRMLNVFGA